MFGSWSETMHLLPLDRTALAIDPAVFNEFALSFAVPMAGILCVSLCRTSHRPDAGGVMGESRGIQDVVRRIRGEFLEMPGLRVTPQQARRLWRLDETACDAVLGALVDARFLARTRDGAFVRHDGNSPLTTP